MMSLRRRAVAIPTSVTPSIVLDEVALVARIRGGDEVAFEQLFRAHYQSLFEFAWRYLQAKEAAEEIVQDVMGSVWEHRATWRVTTTIRAYLWGAVRNRAVNVVTRDRLETDADGVLAQLEVTDKPDALLLAKEQTAYIRQAIATLPPRRRLVMELRWTQGMTHAEIAEVMGITVRAVETACMRALADLRPHLEPLIHP